ncbi:Exo70 exocyst complex subunit [Musa troglodytarum]|uniref:Exocyst subunit Exo70 family protein n=1 Tax=Musa troglodytarum TaxID=320322 RepID=A0A9E7GHR4_9LILI|nr:Exo70 exocyst complex subunit [Musa troglodytarum]
MEENGEEKLIAAVRHIAKTLGRTETMAEDILQVFSAFDGRFSLDKLSSDRPLPRRPSPADSPAAGTAVAGGGGATAGGREADDPRPPLERTIRTLDRQISRFVASDRLIWSDKADAAAFLEAVTDLLATIHDLESPSGPADKSLLDRADDLLQRCMLRLEEEFRAILDRPDGCAAAGGISTPPSEDSDSDGADEGEDHVPVAAPVNDYNLVIDALPASSIADLHTIARHMVDAGFGRECAEAYGVSRRGFVDESIARLGLRPRAADEVQATPWADLEDEIARWVKAAKMAFLILVPSERRLCDRVFASLHPFADLAFAAACRPAAAGLLCFADAIAAGPREPERLFRLVDMYEALHDVLPELDHLLSEQYSATLRTEVAAAHRALGAAIQGIFIELENLIRRDPAKAAVPGGGLHPITRYVMNYLRAACAFRRTLEEVMEEDATGVAIPPDPHHPSSSSLSLQVAWIMDVLQSNLEAKSKVYPEPPLSFIFLMNNGRYMTQKARDSELGALLGEDWIRRQMAMVRRWGNDYQRATWTKVVAVLRMDGIGGAAASSSAAAGKVMRERLRMFNTYVEDIWKVQAGWVVVDEQLRTELRLAVGALVLPVYRNFVARLRQAGEVGRQMDRHLKYSVEDVETRINELFKGGPRR